MRNTRHAVRNTFPETIRETIARHNLVPVGTEVVVGVSGGADSVALLHALHRLGIPVTVAHLNHRLRGAESDADEQFVRHMADELGLPLVVKAADVKSLAKTSGCSIEMAARQARHGFFAEFAGSTIALAHHADDQVETFILKLARGAGSKGLGGMPFLQALGTIRLIRPMLDLSRAQIVAWLKETRFKWREDASNSDETFLRNRVRHRILPLLEKELNPKIRAAILRTMAVLREEDAWMDGLLEQVKLDGISTMPRAAKRRLLREWLFKTGADAVAFDSVEKILALMESAQGSAVFELEAGQRVVIEYGVPRFENVKQAFQPALDRLESLPHFHLTIEAGTGWRKDHGRGAGILPAEASFDADKVGDAPIEVRAWQPGDRMNPLGMEGRRKLQDIFTDQKITRAQRPGIPVVVCRNEIIWLPGYRTARGWEVQGPGGKAVHVRIEPD